MKKPTPEELAAAKAKQEAAYAEFDRRRKGMTDTSSANMKKPAPPTAAEVHSKKAEAFRTKHTPDGIKRLVSAMAPQKKPVK